MPSSKEKQAAYAKEWRDKNPEKVKEQKRRHRAKHRDKIRGYRRVYALKTLYSFSQADYENLLSIQGGTCAICNSSNPGGNRQVEHFQIDHDHQTGSVRGLLCVNCNRGLGLLGDTTENISRVLIYLKSKETNEQRP